MLKADLHLHTAEDPIDYIGHTAFDLIDRGAALGFGALAITLHDRQMDSARVRDYARERGIALMPGTERTIRGRHVLLLNFSREGAESVRTFEDVARLKARERGLVIAPHPYFPQRSCLWSLLDAHADLFDAVEWSYFWTRAINFNARGARWARERGRPLVGNSDLHDIRQLGRTYSLVDLQGAPPDGHAICDAIREGRVRCETTPVPPVELTRVFGGIMWREWTSPRRAAPRLDQEPGSLRVP